MALNKRKVLDSARKFAQKGAKAKALKEYQLLLQADPRDAKLLLEVGDAYRRWGQSEDAIAQYGKVAQQYRQDGFDARAVAVYKQILNLDPKHYAAYVSLSELYQRMGLDSEAIGALQTAADGYHREGRKADALELLRQMAALDPTNTTSRLKVAELLRQEKMPAEALAEYEAAARELENQQDRDQLLAVRARILELKPDHVGSLTGMVRSLMVAGQLDRAEPFALRAVEASGDPAQYELLIELFAQMGNDAKLAEATRGLAKVYRDRGDDDKARELMQRLPVDEVGARSRLAVDVSEVGEPDLGDDELLDDDPFVTIPGTRGVDVSALGGDALELDAGDEIQLEAPKKSSPAPAAPLEGDPDQLLAEASVYLRYGKRAQAINSLRSVLEQDPNHRAALEKLGEAYVDEGQTGEAVAVWLRAAELIKKLGDPKALAVLRDRIATLDPKAAATLEVPAAKTGAAPASARKSPPAPEPEAIPELDLDLEVELDQALDEAAASGSEDTAGEAGAGDDGFSFEVELDGDVGEPSSDASEAASATGAENEASLTLSDDGSFEFEIDPDEISGDGSEAIEGLSDAELGAMGDLDGSDVFGQADPGGTSARPGTTTTTARIQEELEEAEFYIAQEMFDEAESILTRILEIAPNHPSAMLRMGEVQVARGAAPESVPSAGEVRTKAGRRVAGTSERDLGATARFEDGLDVDDPGDTEDLGLDSGDTSGALAVDGEVAADSESATASGREVAIDDAGAASRSSAVAFTVDVTEEAEPEAKAPGDDDDASTLESRPSLDFSDDEPDAAIAAAAPEANRMADPGDSFDLREALADVFNDASDTARERGASAVLSTVEDGFESIFSDFKKGVSATLDAGDYDTRYDLGIAYREMGLFEDAIGEFKICLEAPGRRFDSLYLMGLCARDLNRYTDAVHHLEQALALPDLPNDRLAGVFFDLSLAQSLAGDRERARANMKRVLELEPSFPNAAQKLAELESPIERGDGAASPAATGAGAGQGFESFDDLFAEDAEVIEEATVESFESFDDVVSDVETPRAAAAPAEIEEPEPPSPPAAEPGAQTPRKGARKKISFV